MSANNQIVVVQDNDSWSVWYDGCVDNAFPDSARELKKFPATEKGELEAYRFAHDKMDDYWVVEYGVTVITNKALGPTYKDYMVHCSLYGIEPDWPFKGGKQR